MAPRGRGRRRRGGRTRGQSDNYQCCASTTLSSGAEFSVTAALFNWPTQFSFIIDSITISVKPIAKPMLFQWECFNETGYVAKAFPAFMASNTAGITTRTYRWPKGVEHVNGQTTATNKFGLLRTPVVSDVSTALILFKIRARLSGNIMTIYGSHVPLHHPADCQAASTTSDYANIDELETDDSSCKLERG